MALSLENKSNSVKTFDPLMNEYDETFSSSEWSEYAANEQIVSHF